MTGETTDKPRQELRSYVLSSILDAVPPDVNLVAKQRLLCSPVTSVLRWLLVLSSLSTFTIGCSGDGEAPAAQSTATRPAAASATPETAAAFSPAKLPTAMMGTDRVTTLIGAGYQTLRDKVTDAQMPFSSVPTMGGTLMAQNVSLLYNSFQSAAAPPSGRPFAVQNTVQGYPSVTNATTAFAALKTAWQGNLFQNLTIQGNAGGNWQESFCQIGNFVSTNPQGQQSTSQWYVCMARSGPYLVTVSIGSFPGMEVNSVSDVVRAYFADASRAVQ